MYLFSTSKYQSSYPAEVRSEQIFRFLCQRRREIWNETLEKFSRVTFSRVWVSEAEKITKISRQKRREKQKKFKQISLCWGVALKNSQVFLAVVVVIIVVTQSHHNHCSLCGNFLFLSSPALTPSCSCHCSGERTLGQYSWKFE